MAPSYLEAVTPRWTLDRPVKWQMAGPMHVIFYCGC